MSDHDEPVASCRLMEVKKEVPAWLAHRNKVLASATRKTAAPSDESEIEEDEEVPVKDQEYDDEAARLFRNAGYSQENTSEIIKESRMSNASNETSSDESFSDDSGVLASSTGSSGWSTPLEADMSTSSVGELDDIEEPPSERDEQDLTETVIEESYRSLEEPLNPQDSPSDGRHSPDYTEESYRTEETFETVTDEGMEDLDPENPPEKMPPPSDPYNSGNERSTHSAASFWGNPVRFADPFREKDETDDDREPVGKKWAYEKPDSEDQEEDDSPDPPAAMDGSIHRNKHYTTTTPKEKQPDQNHWMPPSSHQMEDTPTPDDQQSDDGNEGILSAFTTTIAETMRKLTGGDVDTSNHSSRSARVDFAGHTVSTTENIRKYYDKGRNSSANEDMRVLYMPTTIPEIANPNKKEEELFDWVPRKYTAAVPNGASKSDVDEGYYTSAGEQYTSADDENYTSAYTSDDGNYKSTDDRAYTSDEADDIESNSSYEADSSDIDSVDSELRSAKLSPSRTSETIDMTAMEPPDGTNQITRKLFPCHCVHVCICLIVFLVPTIIFGIKYWPQFSSWVVNLF